MTSTITANLTTHSRRSLISPTGWAWVATLSVLFVWFHWHFVNRMVHIATSAQGGKTLWTFLEHAITKRWNPDWSHAMVVPLISLYFVIRIRPQLATTPRRVYLPGLMLLFVGIFGFVFWIEPGRNDMGQGLSMIIGLFGLVLFLLGPAMMRHLWLPIAYLVFFIKVSDRIWNQIANHLQDVAAATATFVLQILSIFIDFDVNKSGNQLTIGFFEAGEYVNRGLHIAEACSGLRMLMAFVALGVAMAFVGDRTWWQRLIMMVMTVPIAVAVNTGRVVTLALLLMVNEAMTKGDFHTFVGMLMLIPAAGLFWLLGWVLDRLVVPGEERRPGTGPPQESADAAPSDHPLHHDTSVAATFTNGFMGILFGGIIAGLLGLLYCIGLIELSGVQLLGIELSKPMVWVLLPATLVLLIGVWLVVRRLLRPATVANRPALPPAARGAAETRCTTISLGMVAGVLLTSVLGFGVIARAHNMVMLKSPVPLRENLYQLRQNFGTWEWVHEDPNLSAEELQYLNTTEYIGYHFRDRAAPQPGFEQPVRLHMAYYTGRPDTVPHVPERCITAGGARGLVDSVTLKLTGDQYHQVEDRTRARSKLNPDGVHIPKLEFPGTIFVFTHKESPDRKFGVVYFFVANNKFLKNPDRVRLQGFMPWDRYSYYCKVEMGLGEIATKERAAERASRFLSTMMPEIMACLPDWEKLGQPRSGLARVHAEDQTNP